MKDLLRICFYAIFTIIQIRVISSKFVDDKIVDLTNGIKQFLEESNGAPYQYFHSDKFNIVIIKPKAILDENDAVFDYNSEHNDHDGRRSAISKEKKRDQRLKIHYNKIKKITNFLEKHYITTNYFFDEMKRIQKTHQVKDRLRLMVEYVEGFGNETITQKLLKCFSNIQLKFQTTPGMWDKHKPNKLVLNYINDPFDNYY